MNSTGSGLPRAVACRLPVLVLSLSMTGNVSARQDAGATVEVYAPFAELLDRYLVEHTTDGGGLVSAFHYRDAHADPDTVALIDEQERRLAEAEPDFTGKAEAIAFWLNAYNFFMLAHILENPKSGGEWIEGVKDYGGLFSPFRVFTRKLFNVGGRLHSLDDIEKGILLGEEYRQKGWKEARVHFAVNCASVGCPPLRRAVYQPDTVDEVLTENTRRALRTPRHLRIENDSLYLSSLFDWYDKDFTDEAGSIRGFISRYVGSELQTQVNATDDIEYIEYDWALNEAANFTEFR